MKTEWIVLILILVSASVTGCSTKQISESDSKTVISTFSGHQMAISDYSGTVLITSGRRGNAPEQYKIHARYPDKIKIEYIKSSTRPEGMVSLLNGSTYLEYHPVNRETMIFETDPEGNSLTSHDYQGLLKKIIPGGNISYLGIDNKGNSPAFLVEITPEQPEDEFALRYSEYRFNRARVWVDPELWVVKTIVLVDYPDTQPIITAEYQDLSVNRGIPDNVFSEDRYLQGRVIISSTHPPKVFEE